MKKLKLKALELGANEVLTRAQLKNVLGGSGGITTTTGQFEDCKDECVAIGEKCVNGVVCAAVDCPSSNPTKKYNIC